MSSIILTTYFSKKKHPNDPKDAHVIGRENDGRVIQNSIRYIEPWYNSIKSLGLDGCVFYDNLSSEFIETYQTDHIKFIQVEPSDYSNNDWRFFVYRNFLIDHKYDSVFLTDGSDVSVVKDPAGIIKDFPHIDLFVCKDSILLSQFPFLQVHQQAEWENVNWFAKYQNILPLINMGVLGGRYDKMMSFLESFCQTRIQLGHPNFNADMWIGQYILRHHLSYMNLIIGEPFTSIFKNYERHRQDVYFIHK